MTNIQLQMSGIYYPLCRGYCSKTDTPIRNRVSWTGIDSYHASGDLNKGGAKQEGAHLLPMLSRRIIWNSGASGSPCLMVPRFVRNWPMCIRGYKKTYNKRPREHPC